METIRLELMESLRIPSPEKSHNLEFPSPLLEHPILQIMSCWGKDGIFPRAWVGHAKAFKIRIFKIVCGRCEQKLTQLYY
jgi:hypothetical protein